MRVSGLDTGEPTQCTTAASQTLRPPVGILASTSTRTSPSYEARMRGRFLINIFFGITFPDFFNLISQETCRLDLRANTFSSVL